MKAAWSKAAKDIPTALEQLKKLIESSAEPAQ